MMQTKAAPPAGRRSSFPAVRQGTAEMAGAVAATLSESQENGHKHLAYALLFSGAALPRPGAEPTARGRLSTTT